MKGIFTSTLFSMTEEGTIMICKGVTGGTLPHIITLPATSLWAESDAKYNVAMELDLARFTFPAGGSNFSYWVDCLDLVTYLFDRSFKTYKWDEAADANVGEFLIRLVLLPCSLQYCLLQAAILPINKAKLMSDYTDVYMKPYFPNFMLTLTNSPTSLTSGTTTKQGVFIPLLPQDVGAFGCIVKMHRVGGWRVGVVMVIFIIVHLFSLVIIEKESLGPHHG